ncbi:MAG TPA: M50 family metallopeptidase [Kofleriaceae bacterium]|nr:M50 family metallopeptidase [Kofleriaceae bacterium]
MDAITILGAILGLGLMIVVHEAGHFVVARLCGMRVERFSIGFGPGLLRWRSKGGTLFQIAPIPFGGFVEIKGMAIAEDVDPDDKKAYPNRPVWQRIATIFAGPGTNYLTAVVLAFVLFNCAGVPHATHYYGIDKLNKDFDAAQKLKPGDRLVAINDTPIFLRGPDGKRTELCVVTSKIGNGVARLSIIRDGKPMTVEVQTKYDDMKGVKETPNDTTPKECKGPRWRLGIDNWQEQYDRVDVGIIGATGHAIAYPVNQTVDYFSGIYQAIKGKEKLTLTGPIGMGSIIKRAIEEGWITALKLLMLLNVLLAIMNLFPLPGLDGGRLAFLGYELVTRRRANPKVETTVHMVGILILMVILVMVTVKECRAMF